MDERLQAYATSRGGVFTWVSAERLGVAHSALRRWARSGEVVRVRRDAYVLGTSWRAAEEDERYRLRTRAVLGSRPGAVASHHAALALHRLPLWQVDRGFVDVLGNVSRTRIDSGVRVHPLVGTPEPEIADGYRCLPIPWAVAQVAAAGGTIAALIALDVALAGARCSGQNVHWAGVAGAVLWQDARRVLDVVERADPLSESPGETRTRLLLRDLGFAVESQVTLCDRSGLPLGRVDFLVDGGVIVEFDGAVKYAGSDGRAALMAEKRREDALRALGYSVVRLTWADLDRPAHVGSMIRRARVLARLG